MMLRPRVYDKLRALGMPDNCPSHLSVRVVRWLTKDPEMFCISAIGTGHTRCVFPTTAVGEFHALPLPIQNRLLLAEALPDISHQDPLVSAKGWPVNDVRITYRMIFADTADKQALLQGVGLYDERPSDQDSEADDQEELARLLRSLPPLGPAAS